MFQDEQWALKFKEHEEQMQLAIEEREMQKVAAVMEHDRKNENLGVQVEQLTAVCSIFCSKLQFTNCNECFCIDL